MKFLKIGIVVFGALIVTALSVDAVDTLNGDNGSMLGQLVGSKSSKVCPDGMVEVGVGRSFHCVDMYEASPSQDCPVKVPKSVVDTQTNINDTSCQAASAPNVQPWTNVTREQAQLLCVRAGKRLPAAAEWYTIAMGTPDTAVCNTNSSGVRATGGSPDCRSAVGVYDAVGNVWEWVKDDVINGQYDGRALPAEGYVAQVDAGGVATETGANASTLFNADYFWSDAKGAYGILRGGFYGSQTDAGVFAIQAKTAPTSATQAIGFRCIE